MTQQPISEDIERIAQHWIENGRTDSFGNPDPGDWDHIKSHKPIAYSVAIRIAKWALSLTPPPQSNLQGDADRCPICAEPFKPDDICASDIEMGTCHATCLEGSPVVDLETGEATGGKANTYLYSEVADPTASQPHGAGSLWDQLVVLSGYHITRPPTPDHEFVQVCNGDLRKMVELMGGGSSPSSNAAGRWRAFEDTTPGYWGIELEDAGNDDDAILYPQKIHRDTVARIVEAHNAALATTGGLGQCMNGRTCMTTTRRTTSRSKRRSMTPTDAATSRP